MGHARNLRQLWQILQVKDAVGQLDLPERDELLVLCGRIEDLPNWADLVRETVSDPSGDLHQAVAVADHLGIDLTGELLAAVRADPVKHAGHIPRLFRDPGAARELTALYEKALPLAEMASGMGDQLFSPTYGRESNCLDWLFEGLREHPLLGHKLVAAGLMSPVVRNRDLACSVLEAWRERLGQPVAVFSPSLSETLRRIAAAEVDEEIRGKMANLLGGDGADNPARGQEQDGH
jgi:hypothetical protein